MIAADDVVVIDVTAAEVEHCKQHYVSACRRVGTGQLKAVGNLALQKMFSAAAPDDTDPVTGVPFAKIASDTGVAVAFRTKDGKLAGIAPSVSMIRNDTIVDKNVVVPANQLYRHPDLDAHYTVAVYVRGRTDEQKLLVQVDKVLVAGWVVTTKLKEWVSKNGAGPFIIQNASLAVAPSNVLDSVRNLDDMVHWKKFRV